MVAFIIILVLLALLGVLGAVIEGLFWLLVIAAVLFAISVVVGWFKLRA